LNPDSAVASCCGLKTLAVPPQAGFPDFAPQHIMNMPTSQNRSNYAFRYGFLRLTTDPTAQSGLNNNFLLDFQ
jgi:hypothetical protein